MAVANDIGTPSGRIIESVDRFILKEELPAGQFSISVDGHLVDFEYSDRGSQTTVILFSTGAGSTSEHVGPFVTHQTLVQNASVNYLSVVDPTLSLHSSLDVGWFSGNSQQPRLQQDLSRIFRKIAEGKRTIYFGQSAGGFAALLYASMHPNSLAMPVNPQVHLTADRMPKVQAWKDAAWDKAGLADPVSNTIPGVVTDLSPIYSEPLQVRVVYIQNTGDKEHMAGHYQVFKNIARPQALAGVALVAAGDGHVAISEEYLGEAIKFVANSASWGRINLAGITASPDPSLKLNREKRPAVNGPTRRDTSRYNSSGISEYDSLESFLSAPLASGMSTFDYHGRPFDLLVRRKTNATTTVVVFHPAAAGSNITRPFFVGTSLTDRLNVNAIFVADPSLEWDDDLRIAWFAGNDKQPIQQDIPRVLSHALSQLGTKNNIFYGASAGGFAALYYSSLFPGSLAAPINPQTRISAYGKDFVAHYARSCWGIDKDDDAIKQLPSFVIEDLTVHYGRRQPNSVLYVQNMSDWHVGMHMDPFMEKNYPTNCTMKVLGEWGNGHVPPPVDYQASLLSAAVDSNGLWTEIAAIHADCELLQRKETRN